MSEQRHRELNFSNFDEVISEIERLAGASHETSGSYSFGQIVDHLATTNDMMLGKVKPPKLPLFYRLMMPLMRKKILTGKPTPGFKLPSTDMQKFFWKEGDVDLTQAIARFKQTVEQYKAKAPLHVHPLFGKGEPKVLEGLLLGHAAMHLGFVHS